MAVGPGASHMAQLQIDFSAASLTSCADPETRRTIGCNGTKHPWGTYCVQAIGDQQHHVPIVRRRVL